jgi:LPPG:FO 2-phospho-L-lactate transferase
MIAVLAGGVGAARFLSGLVQVVDPADVTAIVNVADDFVLHGLNISPDLDTVVYTLAGQINPETGWGLVDETWRAMEALRSFGHDAWFNLGDRDLGTHLYRTTKLAEGATLSEVTAAIASRWGLTCRIVPVTHHPIGTRVGLVGGTEVDFQEYFVHLGHDVAIESVRFAGAAQARPAPGVLETIEAAEVVVIAPSNPVVSIEPIFAVAGIEEAVQSRRENTVAISPIIAGEALKGPAARMLRELGEESSVVGVARRYRHRAATLVIDEADRDLRADVELAGLRTVIAPTVMSRPGVAASLAVTAIEAGRSS